MYALHPYMHLENTLRGVDLMSYAQNMVCILQLQFVKFSVEECNFI